MKAGPAVFTAAGRGLDRSFMEEMAGRYDGDRSWGCRQRRSDSSPAGCLSALGSRRTTMMDNWGHNDGWWNGGMIVMGVFWLVLIALGVWAVLHLARRSASNAAPPVGGGGAVSYTHLTLPTKRIV